jgi:asparagine synthase (glutamine-hydrolysing)
MCGIYISNFTSDSEVIDKLNKVKFRGPDNLSIKRFGSIILGHLRLSIIDLDVRSNQPFTYKNLSIIFNGEIYNYKDLRSELNTLGYHFITESDTEVILLGFYHFGRDFIKKLNGMFAILIYDSLANKIFAFRDRVGVKPLYYSLSDGKFEAASQIQQLNNNGKIDKDALISYYMSGFIPSPFSIYENIKKLEPGSILEFDLNNLKVNISKFWDLEKLPNKLKSNYKKTKEELETLIEDCVKIRLNTDVPLGAFLSGGIDSPIVTYYSNKNSQNKINSFTIGFEEKSFNESLTAKYYSKIIDTIHNEKVVSAESLIETLPEFLTVYDEPFSDSSAIPTLLLSKYTKSKVTVSLSGDGSDEIFLGYNHFNNLFYLNFFYKIPFFLRRAIVKFVPLRLLPKGNILKKVLSFKKIEDFMIETFYGAGVDYITEKSENVINHYEKYLSYSENYLEKMSDFSIKFWLENDSNVKVDRASMFNSLEVRSPFLDYRLIEFARKIPAKYKFKNGSKKIILKDILSKFIDKQKFNLPKKGFSIPLKEWIKKDLKDEIQSSLSLEFLTTLPYFDEIKFIKKMEKHFNNEIDFSRHIWRIYVLNKWILKNNIKL